MYVCSVLQMETLKSEKNRLVEETKHLREENKNLFEEIRHFARGKQEFHRRN